MQKRTSYAIPFLLAFWMPAQILSERPKQSTEEVVKEALAAIEKGDGEWIEGMRDKIKTQHLAPIAATWKASFPWSKKDWYIALLMDHQDPILTPMMEDALDSPTAESRAYALMILKKDFSLHKDLWTKSGWIIPAKVDEAVKKYRAEKKK